MRKGNKMPVYGKAKSVAKHFPQQQHQKKELENPSPKIQTNINKMLKYVLCMGNGVH